MTRRKGVAGRAAATLIDQGICSLGNFLVVLAAVHLLSLSDVGSFTMPYTCAALGLVSVRLLVLQDLIISFSAASVEARREAARAAAGSAALLGAVLGVLAAAVAPFLGSKPAQTWLTMGAILPFLFVQDAWRIYFFSAGRPKRAAVNDGICLAATACALYVVDVAGWAAPATLMAAWGVGGAAGLLVGMAQAGLVPRFGGSVSWIRRQREVGLPLAGGVLLGQGATRVCFLIIGLVSGADAVGVLSTAASAVSPVNTVISGSESFALPEFSRRVEDAHRLRRFAACISIGLATVCFAFSGLLLALPDSAARTYIGAHWGTSRVVLLPVTLWTAGTALAVGPALLLCVAGRVAAMLRLYVVCGIVLIVLTSAGTVVSGATGAAWGLAIGSQVGALGWWLVSGRRPGARASDEAAVPAPRKPSRTAGVLT